MATLQEYQTQIDRCIKASDAFREVISADKDAVITLETQTIPSLAKVIQDRLTTFNYTPYHGADGVGIHSMTVNVDGELDVFLSDGTSFVAGMIVGEDAVGVSNIMLSGNDLEVTLDDNTSSTFAGIVGTDGTTVGTIAVQSNGDIQVTDGEGNVTVAGNISDLSGGGKVMSSASIDADGYLTVIYDDETQDTLTTSIIGPEGDAGVYVNTAELNTDTNEIAIDLSDGSTVTVTDVPVIVKAPEEYNVAETELDDESNLTFVTSDNTQIDLGNVDGTDGVDGKDSVFIKTATLNEETNRVDIVLSDDTTIDAGAFETLNVAGDAVVDTMHVDAQGNLLIDMTVEGQTFTLNCNVVKGADGQDGADGASITNAYIEDGVLHLVDDVNGDREIAYVDSIKIKEAVIDGEGVLSFTLTDTTSVSAGQVDGLRGTDGDFAVSTRVEGANLFLSMLSGIELDAGAVRASQTSVDLVSDEIVFTFGDGSTSNLGNLYGQDGADGRSVTNATVIDNEIVVEFDDGTSLPAIHAKGVSNAIVDQTTRMLDLTFSDGSTASYGPVRGMDGADGEDGVDGVYPTGGGIQEDRSLMFEMSDGTQKVFADVDGYIGSDALLITDISLSQDRDIIVSFSDDTTKNLGPVDGLTHTYPVEASINSKREYVFTMEDGTKMIVPGVDGDDAVIVQSFNIEEQDRELVVVMDDGTVYRLGSVDGAPADYITDMRLDADRNLIATLNVAGDLMVGPIDGSDNAWLQSLEVNAEGHLIATLTDGTTTFDLGPVSATDGINVTDVYFDADMYLVVETDDEGMFTSTLSLDRSVSSAEIDAESNLTINVNNQDPIVAGNIPDGTDGRIVEGAKVEDKKLKIVLSDGTEVIAGDLDRVHISNAYLTDPARELVIVLSDGQEFNLGAHLGEDGDSLVDAYISSENNLVMTMGSGAIYTVGPIRGEDGANLTTVSIVDGNLTIEMDDGRIITAGFVDADFGFNPWDVDENYTKGQSVVLEGEAYMALRSTTAMPPSEDWMKVRKPGDTFDQRAPMLISPVNEVSEGERPYLLGGEFGKFYSVDKRLHRQFQIDIEGNDFSAPIYDVTENADGHQVTIDLDPLQNYVWRARDVNASTGFVSNWSDEVGFTLASAYVKTPAIILSGQNATAVDSVAGFVTSPFSVSGVSETHLSSDWVLRDAVTQEVIYELENSIASKSRLTIPFGVMEPSRSYEISVRHNGNATSSSWTEWMVLTTVDAFTFSIKPTLTFLGKDKTKTSAKPRFRATFADSEFMLDELATAQSQWQVTKVSDGSIAWQTNSTFVEIEDMIVSEPLESGVKYEIRVRYTGGNYSGPSEWSESIVFAPVYSIEAPVLTTRFDVNAFPYVGGSFAGSTFSAVNEKHISTDWEVVSFDGEVLASSYADFTKPTEFDFNVDGEVYGLTDAILRVRYNGEFYSTPWTEESFTFAEYVPVFVYSGEHNQTTRKIDPDGVETWLFSGNAGRVRSVDVDYAGNVVSGDEGAMLKKIDKDGNELWSITDVSKVFSSVFDEFGNVYTGSEDDTVKKYDPLGTLVWSSNLAAGNVYAVAVDSLGNVYAACDDFTVKKLTPSGEVEWTFSGHTSYVVSVAVDQDGYVYSGSYDNTLRKIDQNGIQVWEVAHGGHVRGIDIDSIGNVFTASADFSVRKISSAGEEIWAFSGHTGIVYSVAVDVAGNVYSGSADQTVRKIDSHGNEVWSYTGNTSEVWAVAVTQPQKELLAPVLPKSKYSA